MADLLRLLQWSGIGKESPGRQASFRRPCNWNKSGETARSLAQRRFDERVLWSFTLRESYEEKDEDACHNHSAAQPDKLCWVRSSSKQKGNRLWPARRDLVSPDISVRCALRSIILLSQAKLVFICLKEHTCSSLLFHTEQFRIAKIRVLKLTLLDWWISYGKKLGCFHIIEKDWGGGDPGLLPYIWRRIIIKF